MNEKIFKSLEAIAEATEAIKAEMAPPTVEEVDMEAMWKNDLGKMIAENRADTMEVFKKYGGFIDRKKEEEMEYCKKRCKTSLNSFLEEPFESQLLDDAMKHLNRFIELYRR